MAFGHVPSRQEARRGSVSPTGRQWSGPPVVTGHWTDRPRTRVQRPRRPDRPDRDSTSGQPETGRRPSRTTGPELESCTSAAVDSLKRGTRSAYRAEDRSQEPPGQRRARQKTRWPYATSVATTARFSFFDRAAAVHKLDRRDNARITRPFAATETPRRSACRGGTRTPGGRVTVSVRRRVGGGGWEGRHRSPGPRRRVFGPQSVARPSTGSKAGFTLGPAQPG